MNQISKPSKPSKSNCNMESGLPRFHQ